MVKNQSLKPMETFDKVPAGYKRNSFTAYENYFEPLKSLPDNERLAAYDAIVAYALNGEEIIDPVKNPIANMVFGILKPYLYNDRVKSYNGKKGGAPVGSKNNPLGRGAKRTNQELTENLPKTNLNLSEVEEEVEVDAEKEVEIEDKTIEEDSPIVVVKKEDNNNSSLETPKIKAVVNIAPNHQATLGKPTTEEVVDLIANFEAGKESYKNVLVSAHRIITRMDGAELSKKGKAALNLLEGNDYWRLAVNNSFFCNYDMSNILKVGDAINKIVLSFGIEEAIKIVANLNKSVLNKYDDKSAEEKVAIYIGSILKVAKDCKQ